MRLGTEALGLQEHVFICFAGRGSHVSSLPVSICPFTHPKRGLRTPVILGCSSLVDVDSSVSIQHSTTSQ